MTDTLRDRAARAAKALLRALNARDDEKVEREFLRDHPTHAEEYARLKKIELPKAGPTPPPATQPDLIERSAEEKRRRKKRHLYGVKGKRL